MRDSKTPATYRSRKRSDPIRYRNGWNHIPNDHRSSKRVVTSHVRNSRWSAINSWVDCNRTWHTYRIITTTVNCGLFGIYIGQSLKYVVGLL